MMDALVNKFNQQALKHLESQTLNPFSDRFNRSPSPRPKFNKDEYGKPVAGSLTEKRGQKAFSHINREILELCECIHDIGHHRRDPEDGTEQVLVPFGELFAVYSRISDKVSGLLIAAKKRGYVYFEPEILFQRRDDDEIVALVMPMKEIKELVRKATASPASQPATTSGEKQKKEESPKPAEVKAPVKSKSPSPAVQAASSSQDQKTDVPTPAKPGEEPVNIVDEPKVAVQEDSKSSTQEVKTEASHPEAATASDKPTGDNVPAEAKPDENGSVKSKENTDVPEKPVEDIVIAVNTPEGSNVAAEVVKTPSPVPQAEEVKNNSPSPVPLIEDAKNKSPSPLPAEEAKNKSPSPAPPTEGAGNETTGQIPSADEVKNLSPTPISASDEDKKKSPSPMPSAEEIKNKSPSPMPSADEVKNKSPSPTPSAEEVENKSPSPAPPTETQNVESGATLESPADNTVPNQEPANDGLSLPEQPLADSSSETKQADEEVESLLKPLEDVESSAKLETPTESMPTPVENVTKVSPTNVVEIVSLVNVVDEVARDKKSESRSPALPPVNPSSEKVEQTLA